MIIKCLPTGMFGSNCYVIGENGEGMIIDPGTDGGEIYSVVEENNLKVKYIILTHGHIDHICSVEQVKASTGAPVLVHEKDAEALSDSMLNGSAMFGKSAAFSSAGGFVKDGDILDIGGLKVQIIHTPGHSPGSICIKAENSIFTGDTLFKRSIGRTDLGNGSYEDIMDSIMKKLVALPEDTVVYPGHGEPTNIGSEKKLNPFIKKEYGNNKWYM